MLFFLFDLYWSLILVFWLCEEVNRCVVACGECWDWVLRGKVDLGLVFFFFFGGLLRAEKQKNSWSLTLYLDKDLSTDCAGGWLDICMLSNSVSYFQFLCSLFSFKLWLRQLKGFYAWLPSLPSTSWGCWCLPVLCWCLLPFSEYLSRTPVWMDGCDAHKANKELLDIISLTSSVLELHEFLGSFCLWSGCFRNNLEFQ